MTATRLVGVSPPFGVHARMHETDLLLNRRRFLGLGVAAAGTLGAARLVRAADEPGKTPPRSAHTPEDALGRLRAGTARCVAGKTSPRDFTLDRQKLVGGQAPFAAVLACADSRVVPEFAFDLGRGELFVVRVAGNFANDDGLASL